MNLLTILFSVYSCTPTQILNDTDVWNKTDDTHVNLAEKRCPEIYVESPCLKVFRKRAERTYWAICGKEKE